MLTCHACMRHCLQTLVGDSATLQSPSSTRLASMSISILRRQSFPIRYYATSFESSYQHLTDEPPSLISYNHPRAAFGKTKDRQHWLDSRGVRPATKPRPESSLSEKAISKHLMYLGDPLKLATFVRQRLRSDEFELALDLVRAASKNILCTVSWNHLVDWQLSKGRMNAAIKTYNEMKKRGQKPDGHTYTILFRGCAAHPNAPQALEKGMLIYQSMLGDKSPVKPNTIHMNAVLKMCAKAQNIDAMFTILDEMPDKGLTAPNNLTFTTVLNALRLDAITIRDLSPMQIRDKRRKVMLNARHIWEDVVKRWRRGQIRIDEELVCAMGRVFLVGERQDFDDVLSLIEQTMNIPRQAPRLGTLERFRIEPAGQGKTLDEYQTMARTVEQTQIGKENSEGGEDLALTPVDSFQVTPQIKVQNSPEVYAKPGQNSLSLAIQASNLLEMKEPGTKYWKIFTRDFKVKPDSENFHSYLRLLRVNRASTETVQLLINMSRADMQVKTFRIAMATCARDKLNKHAFANSGKVLDLMQMALKEPDILVLQKYLETAIASPVYSDESSSDGPRHRSKLGQGKQILRALDRLNPPFLNLKAILLFQDPRVTNRNIHEQEEFVDSAIALIRSMIGAYDVLMNEGLVQREFYLDLTKQRSKLTAFLTRRNETKRAMKANASAGKESEDSQFEGAHEVVF